MTKICILVLIGLPGCGKTTLANLLQDILTGRNEQHNVIQTRGFSLKDVLSVNVCFDLLIPDDGDRVTACERTETWKQQRFTVLQCVKHLLDNLRNKESKPFSTTGLDREMFDRFSQHIYQLDSHACVPQNNTVIIIDDNMYYRSMRYEYCQLARENSVSFAEVYIQCSEMEALSNNAQRANRVKNEVIIGMAQKIEAPGEENWEKYSLTIKSGSVREAQTMGEIFNLITKAWDNPVEKVEVCDPVMVQASRQACSESMIHQVDLILRQLVGKYMKELKAAKADKKVVAQQVAEIKASITKDVETGKVSVSLSDKDIENAAKDPSCKLYEVINETFKYRLEHQ